MCYCGGPQSFMNSAGTGCNCSPGYVFGADGKTCVNPYNPSGGTDGVGQFMDNIQQSARESSYNACSGFNCPPGECCVDTVFDGPRCLPCVDPKR
jgi:hypothetical protein